MHTRLTPPVLFTLLDLAGDSPTYWRDFDAADRAWLEQRDRLPLLPLAAESLIGNGLGVAPGRLHIVWDDRVSDAAAVIRGSVGGAPLAAVRLAP